ncbi:hypothetical protein CEP52_001484 [Fusarium oligoseptatum]|uniref:Glycoside hydrolase family 5 domain-containing protein n=1 Tax=Fusarium oligoseptatum TaxID=2604345 RepID=A0A428UJA5_9HYPO|nr:hypothetical protein CEP52_001484 [Fusarium oligoseptatum]
MPYYWKAISSGYLNVRGSEIVDQNGNAVVLRGTSLGGWLNMENFLMGYPGTESFTRAAMLAVMGKEKYNFFFDRFLYHFFTEDDAKFLQSFGLNSLRLPFSYKHFEDDMNPRQLKEEGCKHLDRVIDLCSSHDNHTSYAAFWDFKDHQDRAVWLWETLAQRYKDNPWVAGFNLLNEPADPQQTRVVEFYSRLEKAIRAIDPNHLLFLDGNTYAMEWKGFKSILPNSVYAIHDYSMMGFPSGPRYKGTSEQKAKVRQQFSRKIEFHRSHNVPIWNGEFGAVYETRGLEADEKNEERYQLLGEQLCVYEEARISWALWTYKGVGIMDMMHTSPDSPWGKLTKSFIERKKHLQVDSATACPSEVDNLIDPLVAWIDKVSPSATKTYPSNWNTRAHVIRNILQTFLASSLCGEFAELFRGKSEQELEELAESFAFKSCVHREGLNKVLSSWVA